MKKIMSTIVVLFLFIVSVFAASCYDNWNNDLSDAIAEYNSDIVRCRVDTWAPKRCLAEASIHFGNTLDSAGDKYYTCVTGQ